MRPPITGDAQQDSWMDQVTNLINSGFFQQDTRLPAGQSAGAQGARGQQGDDGFSAATLYLFQRVLTENDIPPPLLTDLIYEYQNAVLYEQGNRTDAMGNLIQEWDGWTPFIPDDDSLGQYIWVITTNIADQDITEGIPASQWSVRTLLVAPTVSYDLEAFGFDFIRANQNMVDVGVRAYRTVGETNAEITDLLVNNMAGNPSSTWVKWTKHSLLAQTHQALAWDPNEIYAEGEFASIMEDIGSGNMRTYDYRSRTDNNQGNNPETDGTVWTIAGYSAAQRNDDIWNITTGDTSGVNLTISAADVLTQTEFRAVLDDETPLPYS